MPDFVLPNEANYSVDKLDGGRAMYNTIFANMYKGLPDNIKNILNEQGLQRISGNTSAAKQAITEAGGDAPGTSQLSALSRVYAGAGSDITNLGRDIAFKDADMQTDSYKSAMAYYNNLIGNATNRGAISNQFNLGKTSMQNNNILKQYEIDEAGKFSFGDVAGSALQAGGTVAGAACCFIFLEALNGELPWWVRWCRDNLGKDETRKGYVRMAKILVPLMRQFKCIKWAVNKIMVKPMTTYGGWYCGVKGFSHGKKYEIVKKMWFGVWNFIGRK